MHAFEELPCLDLLLEGGRVGGKVLLQCLQLNHLVSHTNKGGWFLGGEPGAALLG